MKLYKTYRINTKDPVDLVDITQSRLCYINSRGAYGWCDNLSKISEIFIDAQLKSKFSDKTPHYTIIVPDWMWKKVKIEDSYHSYERVEFLINNFVPPDNGLVVSVYIVSKEEDENLFTKFPGATDSVSNGVEWPFCTNIKWDMKDLDKPKKFVTWNKVDTSFQGRRDPEVLLLEEEIEQTLIGLGIPYHNISYTMSPQKTYDIMSESCLHISYVGASWWLAHHMNIPVLDYSQKHESGSWYGIIRAPGKAKEFPQMTWDKCTSTFKEAKQSPIGSIDNIDEFKESIIRNEGVNKI